MFPHENPHLDRAIRDFMKAVHTQAQGNPQPPMDVRAMTHEVLQKVALALEPMYCGLVQLAVGPWPEGASPPEQLEIDALDGNKLLIDVFRPTAAPAGPLPCIVYCHGGGMAFATPQVFRPLLQRLAELGVVVVAPYFRNSPAARFPAGVNDCLSALLWVNGNREMLGIDRVTLSGESGGGLLALTVPLIALRRGLDLAPLLDAVWVDSPMCLGPGQAGDPLLPSHIENDGYLISMDGLLLLRRLYTDECDDPCAFPLNADHDALRHFPRTTIVVYEFDPLRDEGIQFYRQIVAAGHPDVDCMQHHGLTHSAMMFHFLKPAFALRQLKRLHAFAC